MAVTVVGVSHHGAPLEVRERLAFAPREVGPALARLREGHVASEAVLLSTCNRTELYFVEGDASATGTAWNILNAKLGDDASRYGYVRHDREATAHLFRVTSGLDSMMVGEAQIHGQVRDAWETCRATSAVVLNRLFQAALLTGGRVRSETQVGHGALSVSAAAVQLAKKIFGSLAERRVMVLGAGEMAELALESLQREGVRAAVVANRTFERAQQLAARYDATAVHYEEAWASLPEVDLLLCSTAASRPVVSEERVRAAVERRGDRPLCILDIAVPRDVEASVANLQNVFLYDLDDLQAVVESNRRRRSGEMPAAQAVIDQEVDRYWQWLAGLSAVPVLMQLRDEMNRIRERELSLALRRMGDLTPDQRAVVEHFASSLTQKFLHGPTVRLRSAAANGRGLGVVDAARYLFALEAMPADEEGGTE